MGLLDEALTESTKSRYQPCTVATLDADLRAEIDEALAEPGVTATAVERVLFKRGVRVKAYTLRRHRGGDCTCEPG